MKGEVNLTNATVSKEDRIMRGANPMTYAAPRESDAAKLGADEFVYRVGK